MKLAVVIPALEEADRIERCVRSALAPGVEVVVADGGSRDETASRARAAGARVIQAPAGRPRQLADGASATKAEAIVFLHADTLLPPGFDAAVRGALQDPGAVGGCFALRFDRGTALLRAIQWGVRLRMRLLNLPYGDQALFVRRTALERAGGVPQVPFMEDLDLVRALKAQGRLVRLELPVTTSARRYLARGPLRAMLRNWVALAGWRLGWDRARLQRWYAS